MEMEVDHRLRISAVVWSRRTLTVIFIAVLIAGSTCSGSKTKGLRLKDVNFPVIQEATTPDSSTASSTATLFTLSGLRTNGNARTFDSTTLGLPGGNGNLVGLLSVSTFVIIGLVVLSLANQGAEGRYSDGLSSYMTNGMSDFLYTLADNPLRGFPGIDPNECVKRCICEAHSNPNRYGWIALPFQIFFPPYSGNQRDEDASQLSNYQLAARFGKSSNANCGLQYRGCMFNPLDIIQRMINWLFGRSKK